MKIKLQHLGLLSAVFGALAFPLFYFVYKFGDPEPLAHDFFQYYRLYKDWDINNVNAPFNMRLISSACVHLLYKTGICYETHIAFDKYASWGFQKEVFFCATFFNYLCVVATCTYIFYLLVTRNKSVLLSFCGALLYLLGFGTIFYELMPVTDALSVLLFSVTFHYYLKKSYWLIPLVTLFIFQREYVLLALGLTSLIDFLQSKSEKYYLITLACCLFSFLIYFVLRKTIFYTAALDSQASPAALAEGLLQFHLPDISFLKQSAMTLNLFFIYLGLILYKIYLKLSIDRHALLKMLLLLLQIYVICVAAGHGNNMGRYFYILVPFVIYYLITEVAIFLKPENDLTESFRI
jgi:hypothetical protein